MRISTVLLSVALLAPGIVAQSPAVRIDGFAPSPPDAELSVPLHARWSGSGSVTWSLQVTHTPQNATSVLTWDAGRGEAALEPDGVSWNGSFVATYGPGTYHLRLILDGAAGHAEALLDVTVSEVRTDTASVELPVRSAPAPASAPPSNASLPTTLRFANDTVNADGKAKSSGTALITRVIVGDADGLQDVRRVTFAYTRVDGGSRVAVSTRNLDGPFGTGTSTQLEDRFDLAPMKDGSYVCTITAEGTGTSSLERTFVITDSAPTATLTLGPTARAGGAALVGELVVEDRNFGTGPLDDGDVRALGVLHVQLYRGSSRVEEPGWALRFGVQAGSAAFDLDLRGEGTRSTRFGYESANGTGRLHLPVEVQAPATAPEGTYRVSISASSTIASGTFDLLGAPRVLRAWANGTGEPATQVLIEADLAAWDAVDAVRLVTPWAERRVQPDERGHVSVSLQLPPRWPVTGGNATLVLGAAGDAPSTTISLPARNVPPQLDAVLLVGGAEVGGEAWLHPHARGALRLGFHVDDANAAPGADEVHNLTVEVRDWAGKVQPWNGTGPVALDAASIALTPPDSAERGKYVVTVRVEDVHGAVALRTLTLNLGLRFRIAIDAGQSTLGDGAANVSVRAAGNAPVGALDVLLEGLPAGGQVVLVLPNGTEVRAPLVDGRAHFEGTPLLRPQETAQLRLTVDAGALQNATRVRVVVAGAAA